MSKYTSVAMRLSGKYVKNDYDYLAVENEILKLLNLIKSKEILISRFNFDLEAVCPDRTDTDDEALMEIQSRDLEIHKNYVGFHTMFDGDTIEDFNVRDIFTYIQQFAYKIISASELRDIIKGIKYKCDNAGIELKDNLTRPILRSFGWDIISVSNEDVNPKFRIIEIELSGIINYL